MWPVLADDLIGVLDHVVLERGRRPGRTLRSRGTRRGRREPAAPADPRRTGQRARHRPRSHPDVPEAQLPALFRGRAASDLPDRDSLKPLPHPALILIWPDGSTHPPSVAEELAALLPEAELHVARSLSDMHARPKQAARFLTV